MPSVQPTKLVSIAEYCEEWKIARTTAYRLIENGTLTRYETEGEPLLDIAQRPSGVKKYKGYRKRKIV